VMLEVWQCGARILQSSRGLEHSGPMGEHLRRFPLTDTQKEPFHIIPVC
jgi:hypothetical protein